MQGEVIAKEWEANKDKWDKNADGKMQYVLIKGEPGHPDAEARTEWSVKTINEKGIETEELAIDTGMWDDGKMQYVLIKGEPGHPDAEARTEWSVKTINEKGIETEELAIDTGMWDAAKATEKMDAWLAKFGDKIEFVICNNDGMASGAIASLEKEGYLSGDKFMPVVGVDAIPEIVTLIEEGKVVGTVLNDAPNQAKAVIDLCLNLANGKDPVEGTDWKLDDNKAVRVPYVGITKDNLDQAK